MVEYTLAEVATQRRLLAQDVSAVMVQVVPQWIRLLEGRSLRRVLVVGSGDSWAAGKAATISFARQGIASRVEGPASVIGAGQAGLMGDDMAVVVSASGSNPTCVDVVRRLRGGGVPVAAVTGNPESLLAQVATDVVCWRLDGMRPSPGIRTYQASLLTLMTLAAAAGPADLDSAALSDSIRQSQSAHPKLVDHLVPLVMSDQGPWPPVVTALGAHVGSARYIAAKMVETAGLAARFDDLEDWWHVDRFAQPLRTPLVVLDLPAEAEDAGVALIERARATGRAVIRVTSAVSAGIPEPWWPLWHLGLGVDLALALARHRGVTPFSQSKTNEEAR